MKVPLLDLTQQYQTIKAHIEPAVLDLFNRQQFILGETVSRFEEHLAEYCGCTHAVGVSSGTDALICLLMALGIGSGDEVIVPTFTFFGSAGAVARLGARPVFVDIDPETFNLDPGRTAGAITEKTKAIMPVHLYGQMAPMEKILELARWRNIPVIEDACQSVGSAQRGVKPGQKSAGACLSFYPSKNLSGAGDGGMILCQDTSLAQKSRHLRMHGEDRRYYHSMIGGNFRLDALQALVLDIKLRWLDDWTAARRAHAAYYTTSLKPPVQPPKIAPGNISVFNQYVVRVPRRDELQAYLTERGIGSAIYYPVPLHLQECFHYLGYKQGDCPVAEQAAKEVLALPVFPELTQEQLAYVAETINTFYHG
ncbi:MAG: DegT/DnrJ/EryC1/StrS family aminotransferase [Sedimentisphaerales bacterium]|nr:DegT/DnrJ/EryC1/StrS family aminotransferase [Sedimentisphaerales bacterium]